MDQQLREEAVELRKKGISWKLIATILTARHGRTVSYHAVRYATCEKYREKLLAHSRAQNAARIAARTPPDCGEGMGLG